MSENDHNSGAEKRRSKRFLTLSQKYSEVARCELVGDFHRLFLYIRRSRFGRFAAGRGFDLIEYYLLAARPAGRDPSQSLATRSAVRSRSRSPLAMLVSSSGSISDRA